MLPFLVNQILFILPLAVFACLGWRKYRMPAFIIAAVLVVMRLAMFGTVTGQIAEQRRILGLSSIEPSFWMYAFQSVLYVAVWGGLSYGLGRLAGYILFKMKGKNVAAT